VPAKPSPAKAATVFAVGFPFFVVRGLVALARASLSVKRAARGFRAGLAKELICPNGHPNSVIGRWDCGSCKGVYIGWVGRCTVCAAGASWFPCSACGVSIVLLWETR